MYFPIKRILEKQGLEKEAEAGGPAASLRWSPGGHQRSDEGQFHTCEDHRSLLVHRESWSLKANALWFCEAGCPSYPASCPRSEGKARVLRELEPEARLSGQCLLLPLSFPGSLESHE